MLQYLLKSISMRGDALNPGVVNLSSAAEEVRTVNIVCPMSDITAILNPIRVDA